MVASGGILAYPVGMIISHARRYIFVHAPKTGGTSLALALEARAAKDDILIGDTPKAVKRRGRVEKLTGSGRLWKHSGLSDIHGIVSDQDMADFFVVTLVRNPWDRMVSYYHWLRLQGFDHSAVALANRLSFSEFLREPEIQASFRNTPFSSYVTDKDGKNRCDLYVRLEHLDEDLKGFETHLGFQLGALSLENATDRDRDYRGYFQSGDADLVSDFCAADIKQFGYEF